MWILIITLAFSNMQSIYSDWVISPKILFIWLKINHEKEGPN